MWRTGLLYLDRGDSSIISAIRDAGLTPQQAPGSPTRRFSTASTDIDSTWDRRLKTDPASPPAIQHWIVPADAISLKFARPSLPDPPPLDDPPSYSLNQIKEHEPSDSDRENPSADEDDDGDYFAPPTLEKSPSIKPELARRLRAQRAPASLPPSPSPSIVSTLAGGQRSSRMLPVRPKTNDGLLQLQADPTKTPQRSARSHKRRISLGLPIKSAISPPEELKQRSPPPQYAPPQRPAAENRKTASALIQQERELEYKHRHTFIGTASLDDFLEVLDLTPSHATTKAAVIKAFLILASSERLLARQASLEPSGWGLVARTASDAVNSDYIEQAQAKLGSIVLRQFLDLVPFNDENEASAISVMEAFSAASHLDTKASTGNGSKAKAFRSWLVRQSR